MQIVSDDARPEHMGDNGPSLPDTEACWKFASAPWAPIWPKAERRKVLKAGHIARSGKVDRFRGRCRVSRLVLRLKDVVVSSIPRRNRERSERGPPPYPSRDVAPTHETLDKQAESQRLQDIGRLTSEVAHDFNNLLAVVMGISETLALDLPEGSEHRKLAEISLQASERGADIVRRLLAFSRQQPLVADTIDCASVFKALRPIIEHTVRKDVAVTLSVAPRTLYCTADRVGLESALINLCANARDAMPAGGALSLRAAFKTIRPDDAAPMGLRAGDYVVFTVTDTGVGMAPDILARSVEPFFTTKGMAGGSGLGLSTVQGFAHQSGGRLAISSEEGRGTVVSLYLPRAVGEASIQMAAEPSRPACGGHILFVEDDDVVRAQLLRPLRELGHRVTAVADSQAAMAAINGDEEIDLLFTDVVMLNGMNGRELADRARIARPRLKVLFTSGYTEDAVFVATRLDRSINFLAKPYRRSQLAGAITLAMA